MPDVKIAARFFTDIKIPLPQDSTAKFVYNFFMPDESTNDTGLSTYDDGAFLLSSFEGFDDHGNRLVRDNNGNMIPEDSVNARSPRHVEVEWQAPALTAEDLGGPGDPLGYELLGGNPSIETISNNNLIIREEDITSVIDASVKTFDPFLRERIVNKMDILSNLYGYDGRKEFTAGLISLGMQAANFQHPYNYYEQNPKTHLTYLNKLMDMNTSPDSKRINDLGENVPVPLFQDAQSIMFEGYYDRRLLAASANSDYVGGNFSKQIIEDFYRDDEAQRLGLPKESTPPVRSQTTDANKQQNVEYETPTLKAIARESTGEMYPFSRFVLLGYIVERYDSVDSFKSNTPQSTFFIDGPARSSMLDTTVLYGEVYYYQIRSVYGRDFYDFDETTGDFLPMRQYFSSRPTDPMYVEAIDSLPPNEPDGVFFKYDYNDGKGLIITWQYPVGRQRDTKYFQIFRRKTIYEPFTCIAELDFNNSTKKVSRREHVHEDRVLKYNGVTTFYEDHEFDRSSDFIYAVASIDAHGLTSGYSSQTRVKFNINTNKIELFDISRSGAPKQYPNFFVDPDSDETTYVRTFTQDVMSVSQKQKVKIYLDSDCEKFSEGNGPTDSLYECHTALANTDNAIYKMHFINVDRQKDDSIEIRINDFRE